MTFALCPKITRISSASCHATSLFFSSTITTANFFQDLQSSVESEVALKYYRYTVIPLIYLFGHIAVILEYIENL